MTFKAKHRLLDLSLAFLGITLFFDTAKDVSAQPVNLEAARREGRVVIYGIVVPQIMSVTQHGFYGQSDCRTTEKTSGRVSSDLLWPAKTILRGFVV